ncbi:hypothetical protein EV586_105159 [Tumebacillus sp. BK434]|uniref:hypothetical protein n=1 Tax=Tumebacillus sp. BK434 TaxID=2512169 RepID=UPI00104DBA05|nr:hypothetical protein [Tumebacillus sp. BK434]TCP53815.1 hypothetical protein EV586_105159 [Tumebacillus sp. BK434]
MKIKVWMGITFASLLLMSGGLLAGGATDATLGGNHGVSAVKAEFTYNPEAIERPEPMSPALLEQNEPPEPMGAPVVGQTEPPEPMIAVVVG